MELAGVDAVVSGGHSGIGAAVVRALAARGARPVVWDVAPGSEIACDVSRPDAVREALRRTLERGAAPRVLVHCAGVGSLTPLLEMTPEEWDRVLAINLRGAMLCMQALAREWVALRQPGAIVCISSISARFVDPGMSAYSASKAGLEVLARTAARELGPHGIRVNCVAPGVTDTPLLGRNLALPGFVERAPAHRARPRRPTRGHRRRRARPARGRLGDRTGRRRRRRPRSAEPDGRGGPARRAPGLAHSCAPGGCRLTTRGPRE
jgi:NAD(P)-dependent dehydrogenase (short-subunit alcohol dehydrogenase family)